MSTERPETRRERRQEEQARELRVAPPRDVIRGKERDQRGQRRGQQRRASIAQQRGGGAIHGDEGERIEQLAEGQQHARDRGGRGESADPRHERTGRMKAPVVIKRAFGNERRVTLRQPSVIDEQPHDHRVMHGVDPERQHDAVDVTNARERYDRHQRDGHPFDAVRRASIAAAHEEQQRHQRAEEQPRAQRTPRHAGDGRGQKHDRPERQPEGKLLRESRHAVAAAGAQDACGDCSRDPKHGEPRHRRECQVHRLSIKSAPPHQAQSNTQSSENR
jgi:hypothetical protein